MFTKEVITKRIIYIFAERIGSEVYKAVQNGRKGIGIELKDSYFETACKNVTNAMSKKLQLSLFE